MKRLLMLVAAIAISTPALAQHEGHSMPMSAPKAKAKPKPKPVAKPAPRKPAAKPAPRKPAVKASVRAAPKATSKPATKPVARKAAPKPVTKTAPKPAAKTAVDPHAGHNMPPPPPQPADPHAGHTMPKETAQPAADPMAGHDMGATPQGQTADPMAGHDMGAMPQGQTADPMAGHDMATMGQPAPAPPIAPPPAEALSGPAHAADTVYGAQASARARDQFRDEHGNIVTSKVMIDRLEAKIRDGRDGYSWDGEAWYGGDIDKLWVKSEGEGDFGSSPETAEVQALWSHAIDPWFNLQAGVRYDFQPDPERAHLVLGVQGLARYWFEIDGALFLSDEGDLTARFEAEYDQRITQRLILQPRVEFDLAAQDVPEIGIGSGVSTAEAGLRLRYEIVPEFAPYVGVQYERAFGDTRDYRRAAGADTGGFSFLIGVRSWF